MDLIYTQRNETHRVVAIEYVHRKPHSVITATGTSVEFWDFDWCKTDRQCYFHCSGSGGNLRMHIHGFVNPTPPPGEIWSAIPVVRCVRGKECAVSDAQLLRMGYRRLRMPRLLTGPFGEKSRNPFDVGVEGETVYCARCKDCRLDCDYGGPCEHIEWCDRCGAQVYVESRQWVGEPRAACDHAEGRGG